MAGLGQFFSGFTQSFAQAKNQKKLQDEEEQEKKARLKLFEVQMEREKRAQQQMDEQAAERKQAFGFRKDLFSTIANKTAGVATSPLPGTGVQLGDVSQSPQPMGLAQALADPEVFIKSMQAGVPLPQPAVDPNAALVGQMNNPALKDFVLQLKREGAAKTFLTNDMRQEGAEAQTVGKGFGEQYMAAQKAGLDAEGKILRLQRMSQLMDGVRTGKLTPKITQISAIAESLGIKIDDKLGPKQAIEALTNEMALQLRNPSAGAGMPGQLSDKDREFLMTLPPGLSKTKEGNDLLIETMTKMAERDRETAKLARAYRVKNGALDEGFFEELAQFSNDNPLFEDEANALLPDGVPPGSVEIGTSGGKPVYQAPDGKQYIVE